jgi:aldehyde:ferredoxin oxidoreductase
VEIPRRFSEVTTWKGPIDRDYLRELKSAYGRGIRSLAAAAAIGREGLGETRSTD